MNVSRREPEHSPQHSSRTPESHKGTQPRRKKSSAAAKRTAWGFYRVLVIISAVIVVCYGTYELFIKPPTPQTDPQPTPTPPRPGVSTPDSSQGGSQDDPPVPARQRRDGVWNFVLLGKDRSSGNTDTIIVVSYDTVEQKVGMISIPRDTAVERTWGKTPKINAAYAIKGADVLKEEIEYTFGIPIDYYVYVNLDGFIALVNELEGVDVYIPEDMDYDDGTPGQELHIHYTKGQYHLNGQQAMEVVRFRHNNDGSGYTDSGRAAMQRQILTSLAKKVLSWGSIPKITAFLDIFQKYVKTDLPANHMLYFATQAMLSFDISTGLTQGELEGRGDGVYKGYQWCYVFKPEDILPTLNETVNPYDQDLTEEDLHLVVPEKYYFNY